MTAKDPVKPAALALMSIVDASRQDAAHLAAALQAHRQHLRHIGISEPSVLERLERTFAAIAMTRPAEATGVHGGSEVGADGQGFDASKREDAVAVLLTRKQAARRIGCSLSTLKRRESAGRINPYRHGRVLRYSPDEIARYLEDASSHGNDARRDP